MSDPEKQNPPIDTGGPAFPTPDIHHQNGEIEFGCSGITVRDPFGEHAMQQFVNQLVGITCSASARTDIAKAAYNIADAIISARKGDAQ